MKAISKEMHDMKRMQEGNRAKTYWKRLHALCSADTLKREKFQEIILPRT